MKHFFWILLAVVPFQAVTTEYEPGADFSSFKTYAWVKADAIPLATARPNLPVEEIDKMLRSAIERQLAEKGLTQANAEGADVLVAYQGVVRTHVQVEDQAYSQSGHFKAAVVREGTLTIDVIERSTSRLLWRAVGRDASVSETVDPKTVVDELVGRVMASYPPQ